MPNSPPSDPPSAIGNKSYRPEGRCGRESIREIIRERRRVVIQKPVPAWIMPLSGLLHANGEAGSKSNILRTQEVDDMREDALDALLLGRVARIVNDDNQARPDRLGRDSCQCLQKDGGSIEGHDNRDHIRTVGLAVTLSAPRGLGGLTDVTATGTPHVMRPAGTLMNALRFDGCRTTRPALL